MTVQQALAWGRRQARSRSEWETPPGSNITPVWDDYHAITGQPAYQRQPWCGAELIDIAFHGGLRLPATFISVLAAQDWAEKNSRWSRGSGGTRKGDALVMFGPGVHIEFARSDAYKDGSVDVQGGNTSPGSEGSQADGGVVAIKRRRSSEVYGRIRLFDLYPGGEGTPVVPAHNRPVQPQYVKEPRRGSLRLWQTGPRVAQLQKQLGIADDGYYGRSTSKAVAAFKQTHSLPGTGDAAGPGMQEVLARHGEAKTPRLPTLRRGSKGGAVRKLQRLLIHHGYLNAVIDGHRQDDGEFGGNTEIAVNQLKKARGLKQDGVAGSGVWNRLRA